MPNIVVIEDENDIAELIRFNLTLSGHQVKTFSSGEEGLKDLEAQKPNLLILDIMLPGLSGIEICEKIKSDSKLESIPIMMVSAKGEEGDIIKGLELGADDYVTKPFSTAVLSARVEALLRRSKSAKVESVDKVTLPGVEINHGQRKVIIDGATIELTQSEFDILYYLALRPGWVFTRNQIVQAIHGSNYAVTDRTIDFQMVGLRKKMGSKGDLIETVRGVGYRFKGQQ